MVRWAEYIFYHDNGYDTDKEAKFKQESGSLASWLRQTIITKRSLAKNRFEWRGTDQSNQMPYLQRWIQIDGWSRHVHQPTHLPQDLLPGREQCWAPVSKWIHQPKMPSVPRSHEWNVSLVVALALAATREEVDHRGKTDSVTHRWKTDSFTVSCHRENEHNCTLINQFWGCRRWANCEKSYDYRTNDR